jgi:hypothetical protein
VVRPLFTEMDRQWGCARKWLIAVAAALLLIILILVSSGLGSEFAPFSFCVFGDSRGELILPGGENNLKAIMKVLKQRYPGASRAFEVEFDPLTGLISRVYLGRKNESSLVTLHYQEGVPYLVTQTWKGQRRVLMRRSGMLWVFRRVLDELQKGAQDPSKGASLCLHTGDLVLWMGQGRELPENPYWQEVYDLFLSLIPPPDEKLGLPSRIWPAVGNHETWEDEELKGFLSAFPQLASLGFSSLKRDYSFFYNGCRFIFLDSGGYDQGMGRWNSDYPPFEEQMKDLRKWLEQAKSEAALQVFVIYHKPSYCDSEGALVPDQNPCKILETYGDELNITVFNGHVHTTEAFLINKVRYLVLGAGGAMQVLSVSPRSGLKELYWKGKPRVEEYNYAKVMVEGRNLKILLHRFRPGQVEKPMEMIELYR